MLEMQRIISYDAGDNIVPYIDNRGNFKIYNGQNVDQISIQEVNYKHSDCLVAWKIGAENQLILPFDILYYFLHEQIIALEKH